MLLLAVEARILDILRYLGAGPVELTDDVRGELDAALCDLLALRSFLRQPGAVNGAGVHSRN